MDMDAAQSSKKPVIYIGSQELAKISSLLPSNKNRSKIVHSLISSLGLLGRQGPLERRLQVVTPQKATYKELGVYHTRDYLDVTLQAPKSNNMKSETRSVEINSEYGLEDDCPLFEGLAEYIQLIGGATLTAVKALQEPDLTDIAICWDGGRHHAQKSRASGFCYVADCILAILALKGTSAFQHRIKDPSNPAGLKKERVMYLDLDLHFSDGVSEAFYAPNPTSSSSAPQVLTLSIHHTAPGFFPISTLSKLSDPGAPGFDPFTLSIPLKQGASDKTYARVWPIVEQVKDIFNPDYVVVQCGVDALAGDPYSTFNWSLGGSDGSMAWCIKRILTQWSGKKLLLGGGGYNSPNAARAWAYLTSIALGNELSLDMEIPDHVGFPLYGPSFTLDVPAGNMSDRNTEDYLSSVQTKFNDILTALRARIGA